MPSCKQPQVLPQVHAAHQGMEKTKLLARTAVLWVTLPKDIESMIANCPTCQKYQPAQQREPLHSHDVPPHAWHTIAADLFSWEGKTYLLVGDTFSRFPVVRKLTTLSSQATINTLKSIFDEYGIPTKFLLVGDTFSRFPVVRKLTTLSSQATINTLKSIFDEYGIPTKFLSDNGPQFTSKEFQEFSQTYGFEHTTTSPHFPKSNRFIKHLVGTIKRIFTKCRETALDPHLALLSYRATPVSAHLPSPAELLSGRKFKTILTCHQVPTHSNTRETLIQMKQVSADNYNQHAKSLPPLTTGQNVRTRNPITHVWEPATVVSETPHPRSYVVQAPTGHLRHNRQDIRTVPPQTPPTILPDSTPASQTTQSIEDPPTQTRRQSQHTRKKPERLDL